MARSATGGPIDRRTVLAGAAAACGAGWRPAFAQAEYPVRPVTVVVPQSPGGTNDIVARLVVDGIAQAMGSARFVVENRVGAGGNIGTASAARAQPDGYTLLITLSSSHAINPSLYAKTGFDPVKDFEPVTLLGSVPNVLVVNPDFPPKTVKELLDLARKQSAEPLQYGSAGNGTLNHLLGEMLKSRAGIKMVHVPYRGVAPMLNDMLGGQVKLGFASLPSVISYIQAGSLRPLGVSTAARDPAIPDVPAIGETVPGFAGEVWIALFAPAGLPVAIRDKLRNAVLKAMDEGSLREKLKAQGVTTKTSTPEELTRLLQDDMARWAAVVKEAGAKVD